MKYGLIYKATNIVNGKMYIGQTFQPLHRRILQHTNPCKGSKFLFQRAIALYGPENFKFEVVEDCIPETLIDEREQYWIKHYNTLYWSNPLGYNLTAGGQERGAAHRKLTDKNIEDIKTMLKTTDYSMTEISKILNVPLYGVYEINYGNTWRDPDCEYPIRKHDVNHVSYETFLECIEMLKTHMFSHSEIARQCGVTALSVVSNINTGKYTKFQYPEGITFPIQKGRVVSSTVLNTGQILCLIKDFINGMTRRELMTKYNIGSSLASSYTGRNKCHRVKFLQGLQVPLRDNKQTNLQYIEEQLQKYHKFMG